ncbi:hypothetical protein KUH32_14735 [Thalassococcus sp. CAU 1522]|uniref:Yip1 domain-containing protein n=1 Tax=Thalassococcus arenae TaxID=2851652 RepID=A0ABS6NB55_9RHOB|nr:hypothetical protein [Thalassococcus arenae]MBV2361018.1 hypothetical protein [Thalassococcus arenae]
MKRSFRKQTQDDFRQRVKRIDPVYAGGGLVPAKDTTPRRPVLSVLMGFAWVYIVITVANNRDTIEISLTQGALDPRLHSWVFGALAALLMISAVMLGIHVLRFFAKSAAKRGNSGSVLAGALGAVLLIYTPPGVWDAGFRMLDSNSRGVLQSATQTLGDALPGVDFNKAIFVSSRG